MFSKIYRSFVSVLDSWREPGGGKFQQIITNRIHQIFTVFAVEVKTIYFLSLTAVITGDQFLFHRTLFFSEKNQV